MRFFLLTFTALIFLSLKTPAKVGTKSDLGKKLFFDKRLSKNNQVNCASCHRPESAFADTLALSIGVYGRKGKS